MKRARRFRSSMRRFLTQHLLGWSIMMTVIPAIMIYFDALHEVDELFDASLVQTSKVLNGIISRPSLEQNREHIEHALLAKDVDLVVGEHHKYEKKVSFQIWDANGLVIKSISAPDVAFGHQKEGFHRVEANGHTWLSFAMYSKSDQWWLVVAERSDIRGELVMDITVAHVLPVIVFIPLLLIVVSHTLKRGFHPLLHISEEVEQREYNSLGQIDTEVPEEIDGLVEALNDLMRRLQDSYQRESQFVSDVAHELRTPLAGILIHLENIVDQSEDSQLIAQLIPIKQSAMRLSHLVNQLLASSRSTRELTEESLTEIHLDVLCGELVEERKKWAADKDLDLQLTLEPCTIQAYRAGVESLVSNVLDNALRYAPEQGTVRISIVCSDECNRLYVEDSGIGIPESLREQAKERFFRVDPNTGEGSGLGLAIVRDAADQMHWDWKMSSSDLGGLKHEFNFHSL